jgi:hypothetical protein
MRDYILDVFDAMPFLIIVVMIIFFSLLGYSAVTESSAYREKCEASGGVVIQGKHHSICMSKSITIEVE